MENCCVHVFVSTSCFIVVFNCSFFIEIGGSHLSKQVREAISCTNQCMPSLFLFMVPSYDEKTVFERSRVIAVAIDARQQYFPNEKRYQYEPFVGLEEDFVWSEQTRPLLRDYNLRDIGI